MNTERLGLYGKIGIKEKNNMFDLSFYKNKKVLVTGHTGFKGSWMCKVLRREGAFVIGYSLASPTNPSLFDLAGIEKEIVSIYGNILDLKHLNAIFDQYQPEIVIHMAAQPIVREGYNKPVLTYETNVMGTVNILEAIRNHNCVKSFINVTTDKVYKNNEWAWGYRETDTLDGYDPYSNSKSCSELITNTYKRSFFKERGLAVSTCRAGNVIGGGDFAADRIIPDCIRAVQAKKEIVVRNPYSIRPYQHVLEPVCLYLKLAEFQYNNKNYSGNYNIGPEECDCITTGALVELFCKKWGSDAKWAFVGEKNAPHEANFLKLDCALLKEKLGWHPKWHISEAIEKTVEWSKAFISGDNIKKCIELQIDDYLNK